ncbi:MAG: TIGR03643 family protein [Marinomonas sp.]
MQFTDQDQSRIVEMAWEDRTPFEAIEKQFGMDEQAVIKLMRTNMKERSFKLWRQRVNGRKTKHLMLRSADVSRGYCPTQYKQR